MLEDAGLSTGDSQPVVSGIQAVDGDQLRRSPLESMPAEKQDVEVRLPSLRSIMDDPWCVINRLYEASFSSRQMVVTRSIFL